MVTLMPQLWLLCQQREVPVCLSVPLRVGVRMIWLKLLVMIFAFSALTLFVGRQEGHPACKKLNGVVLVWLSAWSNVQTCIWSNLCHCHSLSLVSVKSRLVLPFWYWLTRVFPDIEPLNECMCVCVCACVRACAGYDTMTVNLQMITKLSISQTQCIVTLLKCAVLYVTLLHLCIIVL